MTRTIPKFINLPPVMVYGIGCMELYCKKDPLFRYVHMPHRFFIY
jgi:hypothetical protein